MQVELRCDITVHQVRHSRADDGSMDASRTAKVTWINPDAVQRNASSARRA
jgi:hypothetical protein